MSIGIYHILFQMAGGSRNPPPMGYIETAALPGLPRSIPAIIKSGLYAVYMRIKRYSAVRNGIYPLRDEMLRKRLFCRSKCVKMDAARLGRIQLQACEPCRSDHARNCFAPCRSAPGNSVLLTYNHKGNRKNVVCHKRVTEKIISYHKW